MYLVVDVLALHLQLHVQLRLASYADARGDGETSEGV